MKKNLFPACFLLLLILIVLFSCKQKNQLQFDDQGITLTDSVTILPHDKYYQRQDKPTRGTTATIEIVNNNDTARTFIVKILEVQ